MYTTRCHIKLPEHKALICVDEVYIRVFKYDNVCCEYEIFTSDDSFSASDYICIRPSQSPFRVNITDT